MNKKLGVFQTELLKRDKYGNYFVYSPCRVCGESRWTKQGKDELRKCKKCSNKETGLWSRTENCPKWKGGRLVYQDRVLVFIKPNHRFFCMVSRPIKDIYGNLIGGYISEHRLKIADYLNRPLSKNEIIHHKNRLPNDNRLENLELYINHSQHLKEHWNLGDFNNRKKSTKPVWNKGLTKETDERVAKLALNNPSHFTKGHIPWNTNLTKEIDSRLEYISKVVSVALKGRKFSEQHRNKMKGRIPWNKK